MTPGPNETHWQGPEPETVTALLRRRLGQAPHAVGYRFLTATDGTSVSWSYAELDRHARTIAVALRHENLRGRPVLLLHPPGLDYIAAFFGCLYAGAVAVPAYPPDDARFGQSVARLAAIAGDSGATHALTTHGTHAAAQSRREELAAFGLDRLQWLVSHEFDTTQADAWEDPGTTGDSLAFLQYTSGSTSAPKGVMVSNTNLLRNLRSAHLRLEHDATSQMVSWLPPYHDMGLIGGLLTPLYGGFTAHLMAPMTFVQHPLLWLRTLSETQASTSVAPNFGFEQCLRRVTAEQRDTLDLRNWRLALNGAEPVRAETLERFADYFAPAGFDRRAALPCYGLAEATLMVTGAGPHEAPAVHTLSTEALESGVTAPAAPGTARATRVVGCGTAVADVEVALVDPSTRQRVTDDRVGEIWLSGPNVARGYWNQPEATAETFEARIEGETGSVWLRTGDLGFHHDGQLCVAGRTKDVVIVQGRNFYPHDIESTVENATKAVRPHSGAAFAVPTAEGEQLAVVYEVSGRGTDDPDAVLARLRATIAEEHHVSPHAVVLVKHSTVPKTTSGKIQRQGARADFLHFGMTAVAASVVRDGAGGGGTSPEWRGLSDLEPTEWRSRVTEVVTEALSEAADRPVEGLYQGDFAELGLDYSCLLDAVLTLERRLGVQVPLGELLLHPHTDKLIELCLDELPGAGRSAPSREPMPAPVSVPGDSEAARTTYSSKEIESWLTARVAGRLGLPAAVVGRDQPLASLGLDSRQAVAIMGELGGWLGTTVTPNTVFDHPSIKEIAAHLGAGAKAAVAAPTFPATASKRVGADEPIAIIGMGCRFPGAPDLDSYWRLLLDGRDAVGEVPPERWESGCSDVPAYGGFLDRVDEFDARFFGITAREAERMDPQQRLLLEIAWQTLEDAGIAPTGLAGSDTGVFVGISSRDYADMQMPYPDIVDFYSATGNAQSIAANRLSYFFDFNGPSLALDTACSSSLVAVHTACQSLRSGECQLALVGGVNLLLTPGLSVAFADGKMLARGGRCRTFDDRADGYVRGEGAGLVCLKPLSAALADGDRVHATISGSSVGHGGRSNGLVAPKGSAQRRVISGALTQARLGADAIGYVEAHGTGTHLGDPIEWEALTQLYGRGRSQEEPCLVGAVKTNIGHLEAAAGIAGLIKAALVVRDRQVPPSLHLNSPNRRLNWENSGLSVPTQCRELPADIPARAGVSSFGFGGTNAHVITEAPPEIPREERAVMGKSRSVHTLCLSAHTSTALPTLAREYRNHLAAHPDTSLTSLCHSANTGRAHLPYRAALTADSTAELDTALAALINGGAPTAVERGHALGTQAPTTAFLFSGQGSQYTGMGREFYETDRGFARTLDRAERILEPLTEVPLTELLFDSDSERLRRTDHCQPALVALEVALAEFWMSMGVRPAALLGHSVGAISAACVAGVLSLEDALTLAAARGRHMHAQPGDAAMISCVGDAGVIRSGAADFASVAIAAVNTHDHLVLSGEAEEVGALGEILAERGITVRQLDVSHAFHSKLMAGAAAPVLETTRGLDLALPEIPWVSDMTGELVEDVDADYWVQHMLSTVRFADGFATLRRLGCDAFVEIGPRSTLLSLSRSISANAAAHETTTNGPLWLPSLRRGGEEWRTLLGSLGRLHCAGGHIDWAGLDQENPPKRVQVPHAVLEREPYWFTSPEQTRAPEPGSTAAGPHTGPVKGPRLTEPETTPAGSAAPWAGMPTVAPPPMMATPPGGTQTVPGAPVAAGHAVPPGFPGPMYVYPVPAVPLVAGGYGVGQGGMWYAMPAGYAGGVTTPSQEASAARGAVPASEVRRIVLDNLASVCGVHVDQIAPQARIGRDLGLDSLMQTDLHRRIATHLPQHAESLRHKLPEDPTVRDLIDGLAGEGSPPDVGENLTPASSGAAAPGTAPEDPVTPVKTEHAFEEWPEYVELQERLRVAGSQGANPYGRAHDGFNSATCTIDGRKLINFAAFNYLGLSHHPRVRQAAKEAVETYGTSSSATPLLFGETPLHHELDAEIASFLGTEGAIVFAGGHATNVATVGHLFGPEDIIVHDEWIHDSTVRGSILSGARRRSFPHNDWQELDRILSMVRPRHRRALVVIEGAYSQDGDIPDLPQFIEIKQRHGSMLMVDEAHSIGVLGATGRGIGEHFHISPADVDLWMGTLSKGIGSLGGYIAARAPIIEYLKYTAPLHIFSTGISPANAAAALESLRVIQEEPERVARVQELSEFFRKQARARGLEIGVSRASAVVPVVIGDWEKTIGLSNSLLENGVNVMPIGYPAVARDACRLRFFINVDHSEADLEYSLDLLV